MTARMNYQFTSSKTVTTPFFAGRLDVSGEAGIIGNAQDPDNWGPPAIAFPDIVDLRDGTHQRSSRQSHVVGGQVQWRKGRHNVTLGADARFNRLELLTQPNPRGTVTFTEGPYVALRDVTSTRADPPRRKVVRLGADSAREQEVDPGEPAPKGHVARPRRRST